MTGDKFASLGAIYQANHSHRCIIPGSKEGLTVSFGEFSMYGRVEVKYLFGAALLVLLSFQRAHADPVGETHRVTTEKTAVLRDAERRDQLRVTIWYPATKRFG
jgi:hypothetical protein